MLTPIDYHKALSVQNKTDLQACVEAVNQKLLKQFKTQNKISQWINELVANQGTTDSTDTTPDDTCKLLLVKDNLHLLVDSKKLWIPKGSTYTNLFSIKKGDYTKTNVENAIAFLMLFRTQLRYRVEFKSVDGSYAAVRDDKQAPVVKTPTDDESVVYDMFYWRTKKNEVGIAKLSISSDWKTAKLVYHYLTPGVDKETAPMEGPVWAQGDGKVTRYLHLHDTGKNLTDNPLQLFISLHVPEQAGKRQYLAGVYATSNRDHQGWGPVCGRVILHENTTETNLYKSAYIERLGEQQKARIRLEAIPSEIFYAISNQRFRVKTAPVLGLEDMPFGDDTKALKSLVGTYRVYQPQPTAIREMQLTLHANGVVDLQKYPGEKGETTGFVYYCDKSLAVRFDYQEERAIYRYHLFVKPAAGGAHLEGIMAGLNSDKVIFSTRVFLKRLNEGEVVEYRPYKPVNQAYLDHLSVHEPDVARFLLDPALNFTDASWTAHLDSLSGDLFTDNQRRKLALLGQFSAFFMTKIEVAPRTGDLDRTRRLTEQRIQLIQMPVTLFADRAEVVLGRRIITGRVFYDGCNGLTIVFCDAQLWGTLLLTVPMPGSSKANEYRYHYGILSRLMNGEPETSALVLHPESEARTLVVEATPEQERDQDTWCYRQFEQMNELIEIERRYRGLASMLFGDWGRFARMPGHNKTMAHFPLKYSTFRQTFFAAACHYATQDQFELCKENLARALRHGFAMYQYANLTPNDAAFPAELRNERAALRKAYDTLFTDPRLKRYVKRHWRLAAFEVEQTTPN